MSGVSQVDGDCDTPGSLLKVWGFVYDGDGSKVKQVYVEGENTLTTYYFAGGSYEVQTDGVTETVKQYYAVAGMTFAMRSGVTWSFFLTDHLGSVVGVTDNAGALTAETRYMPFGEVRSDVGTISGTDYGYTFQQMITDTGLMDYNARAYDPWLGRFVQPDNIVPGALKPQAYNRFGYSFNNPIFFIDPSGHQPCIFWDENGNCVTSMNNYLYEKSMASKTMEISEDGLDFIKTAEGGNQPLYDDGGSQGKGNCTIGIGGLVHNNPCNGTEVQKLIIDGVSGYYIYTNVTGMYWPVQLWARDENGNPIWGLSKNNAQEMLKMELSEDAILIQSVLEVQLDQNQWDAVQSFVINTGKIEEITGNINGGLDVIDVFLDEDHFYSTGGTYYYGLEVRRNHEYDLYMNGNYNW